MVHSRKLKAYTNSQLLFLLLPDMSFRINISIYDLLVNVFSLFAPQVKNLTTLIQPYELTIDILHLFITNTICTILGVNSYSTTVTTIKITSCIVCLIVTVTISNPCRVVTTTTCFKTLEFFIKLYTSYFQVLAILDLIKSQRYRLHNKEI